MTVSRKQQATTDLVQKLIAESVDEVLDERLRGGFDLGKFKSLTELYEMFNYAKEHLNYIGAGSSRMTFALSSGKVLKMAKFNSELEDAGRDQNRAEVEVATTPGVNSIITKVFDYEPNFNWIISELVRPFSSDGYEEAIGMNISDFEDVLEQTIRYDHSLKQALDVIADDEASGANGDGGRTSEEILEPNKYSVVENLIKQIRTLKEKFDMPPGDLVAGDHYGKTANGRVVLLDYGLSWDIGVTYYGFKPRKQKQAPLSNKDTPNQRPPFSIKPPSGKSKFFSSSSSSSDEQEEISPRNLVPKAAQKKEEELVKKLQNFKFDRKQLAESVVSLIEEIVLQETTFLAERIKGKFDMRHFKTLPTPLARVRYADANLPKLGEGSSRAVYAMSGNKVLKIAWDKIQAGHEQNQQEVELSTNPVMKPIIAKVYDAAPDYSWIISEITRPFVGYNTFEQSIGLINEDFAWLLNRMFLFSEMSYEEAIKKLSDKMFQQSLLDEKEVLKKMKQIRHDILKPLIEGIREMKKVVGLNVSDLARYDHYGKTADGRVVVIDYGFNEDIRERHYMNW